MADEKHSFLDGVPLDDMIEDNRKFVRIAGILLGVYLAVSLVLGLVWSREPPSLPVVKSAVAGEASAQALINVMRQLLDKPGGLIVNDIAPPGVWLDNMPAWEAGVVQQARVFAQALRMDFSRSPLRQQEDPDLVVAESQLKFDYESWAFPASEREFQRGIVRVEKYLLRLRDADESNARFFVRAANLQPWVGDVTQGLEVLSLRLGASIGSVRVSVRAPVVAGEETDEPVFETEITEVRTPWSQIDNVFYEARGNAWALLQFLRAIEQDYGVMLRRRNAMGSLQQAIHELEMTQKTVWSPLILNGDGFGLLANHSLVMASHIDKARLALEDVQVLLGP